LSGGLQGARQHRLERRWLERSSMAGEAGLLDWEPHLISIVSDFYVFENLTERQNVFFIVSSTEC
jgi:hypothetical protein